MGVRDGEGGFLKHECVVQMGFISQVCLLNKYQLLTICLKPTLELQYDAGESEHKAVQSVSNDEAMLDGGHGVV